MRTQDVQLGILPGHFEPHQYFPVFIKYLGMKSFLFAQQRTPSWVSLGDKHLCHTKLLKNCLSNLHTCCLTVYVHQFLSTCHCLARFYCQYLVDDKTFFLLFMGAGSCWLDSTIVLFLLLLKWDCRLLQVTTSFLMLLPGCTL